MFFSKPRLYFSRRAADRVEVVRHVFSCEALRGLRIIFLSDIHADERFPDADLKALFSRVNAMKPDLLLLGGDLAEDIQSLNRLMSALSAVRPRLGAFGCMGNNDSELKGFLEAVEGHVRILKNASARIDTGRGALAIGGVEDLRHGQPSAKGLFEKEDGVFRILLSHYPIDPDYAGTQKADLQLSGHTHGGQFNILGLNPYTILYEFASHRWISGACSIDGVPAIVSNGIGMSTVHLRIGAPPQLHLVEFDK